MQAVADVEHEDHRYLTPLVPGRPKTDIRSQKAHVSQMSPHGRTVHGGGLYLYRLLKTAEMLQASSRPGRRCIGRCIGCLKLQASFCKRATRSQSTSSTHNQFLFIITSYPRRRMHYLTLVPWFVGALSIGFLKTDDEPKGYHELGSTHCNTHCNTHLTLTAWFVGALRIGCLKTDDECPEDVEPKGYHELGSTHCNTHCNTHTLMMSVPRMRG